MNEFLIFHSSNNTPGATVERIRRKAKECAARSRVNVRIMAIDVDGSSPKNKFRQTKRLIECTTVLDDEVQDHEVNPTDTRICELVADLKTPRQP
jgi:hypothetical protein